MSPGQVALTNGELLLRVFVNGRVYRFVFHCFSLVLFIFNCSCLHGRDGWVGRDRIG